MFKSKKKIQEELERQKKEAERLAAEKEYKEKVLYNQTVNTLKKAIKRYEDQIDVFIGMARESEKRGLKAQYNMAANGLKIVIDSRDRVSAMYMSLVVSNQIKQVTKDTKLFIDGMSSMAKQLSDIDSSIDFAQLQLDYGKAMTQIGQAEEKLQAFSDNVYSAIDEYAGRNDDVKVDKAIDELIHSDMPASTVAIKDEDDVKISGRIEELEALIHGK